MRGDELSAPAKVQADGSVAPPWIRWIGATTVGYALGVTLSAVLVGAIARPFSAMAGGIIVVFLFGAVIGVVISASQLVAIPRGGVPWRGWILATVLGGAVGFAVAAMVGEVLGNTIDPTLSVVIGGGAIQIASGATVGLGIGFAQWFVLRRLLPVGRWWIVASVVGSGLGYGAAVAVLELFDVPILKANLIPSFGAILGMFVGVAQGLVLWSRRRQALSAGASA